ncbi:ABC transporter substrate-binding protein [Halomicrobium salinisoli]|uniref:ABC transporter substrate-binding protein n=1 Tax=Halomicrobium salinisoli TaxID=2878391 RepID=UPI001CF01459|nr:ABC transporter substrate-binding protein [Halomicrobium salinisoli]
MSDDSHTRRNVLKSTAGLAALGAVAGCTESGGSDAASDSTESESSAYTASMEPVGEVTFQSVPETWVANNGSWADMGIALGQDPPEGVWLPRRYHTQYYDEIPDVEVSTEEMTQLSQSGKVDKELFLELDADVHVIDPNFLLNRFDWSQDDVDQIENQVGPFFGNSIFSTGYTWHEDYQYYSLLEAFEKLSQVFQEPERYEEFAAIHEEFQSSVAEVVPEDESERPAVAIMWAAGNEPEEFSPYLIGEGTSFKQWRDLGVRDALAETDVQDFHETRGRIDYETLLEIDPQYLMFRGHEAKTREEFEDTIVSFMEDHDVASDLTAVTEGNVYRGGPLYQGPITNLVVTERAASQVYGVDEELFDRQRVSDAVNGNF